MIAILHKFRKGISYYEKTYKHNESISTIVMDYIYQKYILSKIINL